jgi:TRAP-type C4-dicarboxylate transport system permease small subunit
MIASKVPPRRPRWLYIPIRVLLVTFLLTLLSFAVSLMLGILGTVIAARLRGLHPNMTNAYRQVAAPIAAVAGVVALISMIVQEVRRYRREKALTAIERSI